MELQDREVSISKQKVLSQNVSFNPTINIFRQQQLNLLSSFSDQTDYIPVQGIWHANQTEGAFDLETQVEKFISPENEQKILLILGDSGAGKSSFCQQWAKKQWE